MPSVGTSFVGRTHRFSDFASSPSDGGCGAACQSMARSMVWTRLVTFSTEVDRATTKRAPLLWFVSLVPLVVVSLLSERCHFVLTIGIGTHTVALEGASNSCTVVVTSKLRHLPGFGSKVRFCSFGKSARVAAP